jgi:hypothetical protein
VKHPVDEPNEVMPPYVAFCPTAAQWSPCRGNKKVEMITRNSGFPRESRIVTTAITFLTPDQSHALDHCLFRTPSGRRTEYLMVIDVLEASQREVRRSKWSTVSPC